MKSEALFRGVVAHCYNYVGLQIHDCRSERHLRNLGAWNFQLGGHSYQMRHRHSELFLEEFRYALESPLRKLFVHWVDFREVSFAGY